MGGKGSGIHSRNSSRQTHVGQSPGYIYRGPAFRIPTDRAHLIGKTALDVIRYEVDILKNEDVYNGYITIRELKELRFKKFPAHALVWIYPHQKRGSEKFSVRPGSLIVCNCGGEGILLLQKNTPRNLRKDKSNDLPKL